MTDKTEKIGFRGSLEYRRKIHQAAFDRGMKVQAFLEHAVALALAETQPKEKIAVSPQHSAASHINAIDLVVLKQEIRSAAITLAKLSANLGIEAAVDTGAFDGSTQSSDRVPDAGADRTAGVRGTGSSRPEPRRALEAIGTPKKGAKRA